MSPRLCFTVALFSLLASSGSVANINLGDAAPVRPELPSYSHFKLLFFFTFFPSVPPQPLLPSPPPTNRPASADATSPVVASLPSAAANSVAENFSAAETLTAGASGPTKATKSSPKSVPTAAQPGSGNSQPDVGPLVDLNDAPEGPPSSNPGPPEPAVTPAAAADDSQTRPDQVGAQRPTDAPEVQRAHEPPAQPEYEPPPSPLFCVRRRLPPLPRWRFSPNPSQKVGVVFPHLPPA